MNPFQPVVAQFTTRSFASGMIHWHKACSQGGLICLMTMTWLICVCGMTAHAQESRKLAVVVGVNTYRANSDLPSLTHAVADASKLSAVLRTAGFTVIEMTHEIAKQDGKVVYAPNLDYIRDQISGVLDFPNLGANDAILITLHGHGVQYDQIDDQGKKTAKFYFCPADATVQGVKSANELSDRNHLLPLDELYASLAACKAGTKLLIVDACRNDPSQPGTFRAGSASATLPKLPPPPGGTVAFFSCKPNQMAIEDKDLKQGVFTHFLVEGLSGKADQPLANQPADGIVTFAELAAYVANNTYSFVFTKYQGRKQSPEMRGEFDLNLPLTRIARATTVSLPARVPSTIPASKPERVPSVASTSKPSNPSKSMGNSTTKAGASGSGAKIGDVRELILPGGVKLKLLWCQAGEFQMGSPDAGNSGGNNNYDERPQHAVKLTKGFWLGQTEVTLAQWNAVSNDQPWNAEAVGSEPDTAASWISWNDAVAFCQALTEIERRAGRLTSVQQYTLPTEAQWEYACRADTSTTFSFGDDATKMNEYGWWGGFASEEPKMARRVAQKRANPWGFYDMHGNVLEWCQDDYDEDAYRKAGPLISDPLVTGDGRFRVLRSGDWMDFASDSRSARRYNDRPDKRSFITGFRISMTP